jgi:hypothetical protein
VSLRGKTENFNYNITHFLIFPSMRDRLPKGEKEKLLPPWGKVGMGVKNQGKQNSLVSKTS